MSVIKTHSGNVITRAGVKRVRLHQSATAWVVGPKEYYYKESGLRGGVCSGRGRLVLNSITPIAPPEGVKLTE